jgi:hypothetical protein
MNLSSRWVAAGVVLVTVLVCVFGVRAELAQARRTESQQNPQLAISATADLACGTDAAARC